MRGVSFKYGGPESPDILKNITLDIAPGRMVALVGRSGCGKTTLIKLIAGLLEPTEGTILFDHIDLKTLNYRDVRRHIGMVLQENHIFNEYDRAQHRASAMRSPISIASSPPPKPQRRTTSSCACR